MVKLANHQLGNFYGLNIVLFGRIYDEQDLQHTLNFQDKYFTIQFNGEITTDDSNYISSKVIQFIRNFEDHPIDIIMDIRDGTLKSIGPLISMAMRLQIHIYRFNYCYVVGGHVDKYKYAFSFFKLIQAKRHKVLLVNDSSEALIDINSRLFKRLENQKN